MLEILEGVCITASGNILDSENFLKLLMINGVFRNKTTINIMMSWLSIILRNYRRFPTFVLR